MNKKIQNVIMDNYGNVLYEPCNISVIREMAGLKQVELSKLSGLTQAYISEVESSKKMLTQEASEKIAKAFNILINEPGETYYKIDPVLLWAGHVASFQPKELQKRIIELFIIINDSKEELYYILEHKKSPIATNGTLLTKKRDKESMKIVSIVKKQLNIIQKNKESILDLDADVEGGSIIGFMPRF